LPSEIVHWDPLTVKFVFSRLAEKSYHEFGSSMLDKRREVMFLYVRGRRMVHAEAPVMVGFSRNRVSTFTIRATDSVPKTAP